MILSVVSKFATKPASESKQFGHYYDARIQQEQTIHIA